MEPITLLVAALATARLTRLITSDRILQAPRNRLLRRLDSDSLAAYLLVCNWCVSVYAGAAVAVVGAWTGVWPWPWTPALALAFSYVAGHLASKEDE
jgi:hypothetical protein